MSQVIPSRGKRINIGWRSTQWLRTNLSRRPAGGKCYYGDKGFGSDPSLFFVSKFVCFATTYEVDRLIINWISVVYEVCLRETNSLLKFRSLLMLLSFRTVSTTSCVFYWISYSLKIRYSILTGRESRPSSQCRLSLKLKFGYQSHFPEWIFRHQVGQSYRHWAW